MSKKIFSNMTFWVVSFGIAGYLGALLFGDKSWVDSADAPLFYELILSVKVLFIKLLRLLIAPVVFISIIAGLLGIGSVVRLKQMGKLTLSYYFCTTAIAALLGLVAVFFIHPWENSGVRIGAEQVLAMAQGAQSINAPRLIDPQSGSILVVLRALLDRMFVNPLTALVELNILGIVFNAFVIGLAMLLLLPQDSPPVKVVNHLNRAINYVLGWVLKVTPLGVFAILFDFTLRIGGAVLDQLLSFAILVVVITLLHGLVILPLIGYYLGGVNPWQLFRRIAYPMTVAFSTASSSATLPVSIRTCRKHLGVPDSVASFVLPLGATMNMDGTALFEGIAAVFLAYLFGIDLSTTAIFAVFLMAMVSSIGAPGMPSGSMAGMQMVLLAAGIPLEAIALLLVVERPLDTVRTAVNVQGDIIGALVVKRAIEKRAAVAADEVSETA
jgi:Na+/H+-dicarboxylate symporter